MRSLTAGTVLAGATQCHAWRHRSALQVPRRDWGAVPGGGREGGAGPGVYRGATATR